MPTITAGRLLKAGSFSSRTSPVSFAYSDIEQQCASQRAAMEEECQRLLQEALEHAEQLRSEAEQAGLQAGRVQAEMEFEDAVAAEVQVRVEQRLEHLIPALQSATAQLIQNREQILLQWESAVIRLSVTLAERILHRELETRPEAPRALVAEALQLTAGSSPVRLRMHPADVADVHARPHDWEQLLALHPGLTLVSDSNITRGGCLLDTPAGEIDGRIETQLSRIAAELLGEVA